MFAFVGNVCCDLNVNWLLLLVCLVWFDFGCVCLVTWLLCGLVVGDFGWLCLDVCYVVLASFCVGGF